MAEIGVMGVISIISTVAGYAQQMSSQQAAKRAAQRAAQNQQAADEWRAKQYDQNALQAQAGAQRSAQEEQARARLVTSRALALSAASGAGASDPSVVNLLSDIEGEGSYRAGAAIYGGEERARQMRMGADASRFEGQMAIEGGNSRARAYDTASVGTALSGGSSLFTRFGQGGPRGGTQAPAPVEDRFQLVPYEWSGNPF